MKVAFLNSATQSQTFPRPQAPSQHPPSPPKRCLSYGDTSQLRVPEEPAAEEPASPEESSGLSLLHQESKRRAMLAAVLEQEVPTLAENLLEQEQDSRLSKIHVELLLRCLGAQIHTPNRRQLAQELRTLQAQLRAQSLGPALLKGPLFAFPDAVKQILRRRQIRPHWMFVLDSLLSRAVRAAMAVLDAESEKKAVLPRSEESSKEESQQKPQESQALQSQLPPEQGPPSLMVELGLLRAETDRLRDLLAEKERECQALVQQALHRVHAETRKYAPASETPATLPKDQNLVRWLQELSVDPATIQTLLSHSFTLQTLLTCATQDDLVYTRIRGGMVCRIWRAILAQRAGATSVTPVPRDAE